MAIIKCERYSNRYPMNISPLNVSYLRIKGEELYATLWFVLIFYNLIWFWEFYLMPSPVRKVARFQSFHVKIHSRQNSKVIPSCWILIGQRGATSNQLQMTRLSCLWFQQKRYCRRTFSYSYWPRTLVPLCNVTSNMTSFISFYGLSQPSITAIFLPWSSLS